MWNIVCPYSSCFDGRFCYIYDIGMGKIGSRCLSVLVELNSDEDRKELDRLMSEYGLEYDKRFNDHMTPHSKDRRQGLPYNLVYTRIGGLDI